MKKQILNILVMAAVLSACGPGQKKEAEEEVEVETEVEEVEAVNSRVYFISPADGDVVPTTFMVEMGVEGMEVEPAGEVKEGYGHHHILLNQAGWPEGEIIPPSDTTLHYGKGQTTTELTLEPGDYVLSLQFADGVHRSYGQSMSASVRVTVE